MGNSLQKPNPQIRTLPKRRNRQANRRAQKEKTLEPYRFPQKEETVELYRFSQKEETLEEEEENGRSFTCEICLEPMAADNKFKNKNLCSHPYCKDCIAKHIEFKIQYNTAKIYCPGGRHCKQILDPISCKPLIPENLFTKWCDLLCEDNLKWFERTYCPNRNCGALVVNECERKGKVKKAKCAMCKQWFCFQCKVRWHAWRRCADSRRFRDPNDIAFEKLLKEKTWVTCPCCGHCVEHTYGCLIITCRFVLFCFF
ncbi:RBR-type E3 ubiquitin transferase [Melia azedarach]|uniref:RBR-type E3 ubiquitin transferase n=1 Tax=Melia azedarach TaxID=155640 RepID=A0ACC1YLX9_MELAZ|nr:RBR-type E3 ubiquitin transferase [Melia azedarach]